MPDYPLSGPRVSDRVALVTRSRRSMAARLGLLDIRLEDAEAMIVGVTSGLVDHEPPGPVGEGGWGLSYAASKATFSRIAGIINADWRPRGVWAFNPNPGYVITEAGRARGDQAAITAAGFPAVPASAAARVTVWLATAPDADRLLGKSVWAPKVAADLDG